MPEEGIHIIFVIEMNLWETKDDLYSYAFLVGSIHRSKVSDSSAHGVPLVMTVYWKILSHFSTYYTSDISLFSSRVRKYS